MPFDIAKAAREIAAESVTEILPPVSDTLGEFARRTIAIKVPIKDRTMLRLHLKILRQEIDRCLADLSLRSATDTMVLLGVAARLKEASKKINCYKRMRPL